MELTRTQIVKGSYIYPDDLVKLNATRHFIERLEQRGVGIDCVPTVVRVTKDNIHSGKTIDGKRLESVVVRLKYNSNKYIFLCFNPFDGFLKTLWFRDKHKRNGNNPRISNSNSR
jgi:hypothetical protein